MPEPAYMYLHMVLPCLYGQTRQLMQLLGIGESCKFVLLRAAWTLQLEAVTMTLCWQNFIVIVSRSCLFHSCQFLIISYY